MVQLDRKLQRIFGNDVPTTNVLGQFGSAAEGNIVYSNDIDTLQLLDAFGEGWASAVINNNAPAMQDFNTLHYIATRQLAYLMQAGIPEYLATETYYTGATVRDASGKQYVSIDDGHAGESLTDPLFWEPVVSSGRGSIPLGAVVAVVDDYHQVSVPAGGAISIEGFQLCDGAALGAGATVGTGATLGTNTPDLTDGRFLRGSTVSGTTGGSATKTLAEANLPSHTHTINHTHSAVASSSHTHSGGSMDARWYTYGSSAKITTGSSTAWTAQYNITGISRTVDGVTNMTNGTPVGGNTGTPSATTSPSYSGASGSTGSGTAFNIEPAYLNVKYVMRVR